MNVPSWLKQFNAAPELDIRSEVLALESRTSEAVNFIDCISGSLDFRFTDEEIKKHITKILKDFRARGILVTNSEFVDDGNWYPQRSINLQAVMETPNPEYVDVTRILGADYMQKIFSNNDNSELAVPKYKLVVDDLNSINVIVTCSSKYGLVFHGVKGLLYAEKITGVPKMKEVYDSVNKVAYEVGIQPGTRGFYEKTHNIIKPPQKDIGSIVISSRWEDYGPGLGPVYWDNVLYNGKYYFIDTELKSFHILYKDNDLGQYLREKYIMLRGSTYKSKFDTLFTVGVL